MLLGSALLMTLQGCARPLVEAPPPRTIGVAVKDTPPAELIRCPDRPEGFPTDEGSWAVVPPAIRAAAIRLATAFAASTAQLERLIEWESPGACAPEGVE